MKKIKEKPKTGKAKGTKSKSQPALAPRQAAKLMKDKYLRQFDQRQEGRESETTQAIDQLEDGGQFVADELAVHTQPHRSRQRDRRIKEKPQPGQEATKQAPGPDGPPPPEGPPTAQERPTAATPKERTAQIKTRQAEAASGGKTPPRTADQPPQAVQTIKERPASAIKSGKGQPQAPIIKERGAYRPAPPPGTVRQAGQTPAARGWSGPASGPPQRPRGGGGRGRYRPTFPPGPCRPSSGGAFPASRELPQAGPHRVPRPSRPPKPSPARGGSSHGAGPAPKPPYPSAGVSPMPKHPLRPRRPGRPSRRRPGPSGPLDRPPSGV